VVDHPVVAAMDGRSVAVALPVLQPGWLSRQGTEVARLVYLCRVQMAKATGLLVQEALPWLRAAAAHRALVFLAQMVKAAHLRELLSRLGVFAQLYLVGPVKSAALPRRRPDSRRCRVMRCPLAARPHELAAECSWDFQF
jgi:hypothetical protein